MGQKVKIIAGMPRSGSTSLLRFLNKNYDIIAFGETGFWGDKWIRPKDGLYYEIHGQRLRENLSRVHFTPAGKGAGDLAADSKEINEHILKNFPHLHYPISPGKTFVAVCKSISESFGSADFVEKTPHHLRHWRRIISFQQDIRCVILLREPQEFLLSYKFQGNRRSNNEQKRLEKLYNPFIVSYICAKYLKSAETFSRKFPNKCMIVNLIDDTNGIYNNIHRIEDFWDLDRKADVALEKTNSSFPNGKSVCLETSERFWIYILTKSLSEKCGLTPPKSERFTLAALLAILDLPFWFARNVVFISREKGGIFKYLKRWL